MIKKIVLLGLVFGLLCIFQVNISSSMSMTDYVGADYTGSVIEFSGHDIGSPLREGARTITLPLAQYPIDRIEVRWRAKKGQEARGWLFLDNKEYDWDRTLDDTWKVETWDNVLEGYHSFQLGVAQDDDDSTEDQVNIDWVRVFYRSN